MLANPLDSKDIPSKHGGSAPNLIGKSHDVALYYLNNCSVKENKQTDRWQCEPKGSTEALCRVLVNTYWTSGITQ